MRKLRNLIDFHSGKTLGNLLALLVFLLLSGLPGAAGAADIPGVFINGNQATDNDQLLNLDIDIVPGGANPSASGNIVRIDTSGSFSRNILGGTADDGQAAFDNTVTVDNGIFIGGPTVHLYGAKVGLGTAEHNAVIINNGTVGIAVDGGSVMEAGDAVRNTVTITGGTLSAGVTGGAVGHATGSSATGNATGNSVTVDGGILTGVNNLYGAQVRSGTAKNNAVTINDGTVGIAVDGGSVSEAGDAVSNTVTITGGALSAEVTGGAVASGNGNATGNATGNKVIITGGTLSASVTGGYADNGTAAYNSVTVDGGIFTGGPTHNLYGALVRHGAAENNAVIINGVTVDKAVIGGNVFEEGDAVNNNVTVSDSSVAGNTTGGRAVAGEVRGNSVSFSNSATGTDRSVMGGNTDAGAAVGNSVSVSDSTGGRSVIGGYTQEGDVADNRVSVSNSAVTRNVSGGYTEKGDAADNSVTISGGSFSGPMVIGGGYSAEGEVARNSVTISDGSFASNVYGGRTENGTAESNNLTIENGTFASGGYGGYTQNGAATNNAVNISGGSFAGSVYGGYTQNGAATGNIVDISGGHITGNVYGGYAESSGSGAATASGNTVMVSGGVITGTVYGGYAHTSDASAIGTASGNTVIIQGDAEIHGAVYGGRTASSVLDEAVNNRVVIYGTPDLTDADIAVGSSLGESFAGNTLVVATDDALTIRSVNNVENFEFVLSSAAIEAAGGSYTALTVTDNASISFGDGAGAESKITGINIQGAVLTNGTTFKFFDTADASVIIDENTDLSADLPRIFGNSTVLYSFTVNPLTGELTTTGHTGNPQTKALSEGFLTGLALLNQGADHIAGAGISNAVAAAGARSKGEGFSPAVFGAFSGGKSRYNTGSHVDVSGFSLLAGLSFGTDLSGDLGGRLTLGAFFEYGQGDYDSYNSFSNAASVKGSGDSDYLGGGLLGRMDFSGSDSGHLYAEASARLGRVKTDFSSSDLSVSQNTSYDASSAYYGLHLGTGYVWSVTDAASLDFYGKYFWTHQNGDSVKLNAAERARFDDVDSHRARLGTRFSYAVNEQFIPYAGAAWDYEFDGKARATTGGASIQAPDLKGSTGIGELGFVVKPSAELPLYLDLGVQGYVGQREGVTGSLQLKFEF
jgi:hypothetical protein